MGSQVILTGPEGLDRNVRACARPRLSFQRSELLIAIFEACVIITAAVLGESIYQKAWLQWDVSTEVAVGWGIVASLTYVTFARSAGLYQIPALLNPVRRMGKILLAWALGLLALTAIFFLLKVGARFSRGSLIAFACLELPSLLVARWIAAVAMRGLVEDGVIAGRPVITIGDRNELARLSAADLLSCFGVKEVSRITVERVDGEDSFVRFLQLSLNRASLNRALDAARDGIAAEFIIAIEWSQTDLLANISEALSVSPLTIRLIPDHVVRSALQRNGSFTVVGPLLSVELQRASLSPLERILKRTIDLLFAFAGIVILMPVLVLVAIAIRLDSEGPVLFRQRRAGFNERRFVILKFRTMHVLEDGDEIIQACRKDPRVTRMGKILRATSIDELPQLFNVLMGDMSLVGPRPHALAHDDQYRKLIDAYCFRHHVKPGITGWAQINGLRGETRHLKEMQRRVEYDLWYINNWSFWLDMRILMRTCFELFKANAF